MIKIYKNGTLVHSTDVPNTEENQKRIFGLFIAENKIKIGEDKLPLLDLYTKTLRENGYNAEGF